LSGQGASPDRRASAGGGESEGERPSEGEGESDTEGESEREGEDEIENKREGAEPRDGTNAGAGAESSAGAESEAGAERVGTLGPLEFLVIGVGVLLPPLPKFVVCAATGRLINANSSVIAGRYRDIAFPR
jgi:hypothetical protein